MFISSEINIFLPESTILPWPLPAAPRRVETAHKTKKDATLCPVLEGRTHIIFGRCNYPPRSGGQRPRHSSLPFREYCFNRIGKVASVHNALCFSPSLPLKYFYPFEIHKDFLFSLNATPFKIIHPLVQIVSLIYFLPFDTHACNLFSSCIVSLLFIFTRLLPTILTVQLDTAIHT